MDIRDLLTAGSVDPQKLLKIVLAISVVLLALWLIVVSRMDLDGPGAEDGTGYHHRTDSLRQSLVQVTDSSRISSVEAGDERRGSGLFLSAFTTFLVLITLLGLVWAWSRKQRPGHSVGSRFRQLGSHSLGQGAQMKVLEVNDEVWVVGVSSSGPITLLHRYQREEWEHPVSDHGRDAETNRVTDSPGGTFLQYFRKKA